MRERRSRSSNAWRDWPLARKLALLTTFMLLAVLAVTAAQLAASRQLGHALADRELGRREFTLLRDLERGLYSVQTGQRGYLLSGDAAFLAPYTSGRQGIEAALESLEGLGRHAAEARDLRRLASGYVDGWVAPSLRRYRPGDLSAGEQREIASEGKSRLDAVLAGLEAVTSQVDEDFAAARAASEVAAATLTWLPLASLAFLSLAFTGLRYGLGRFVTQPITRLRDATERLAAGDYAARVPVESNDEIGQLAGTFNATAAAIEHSNAALRERTRDLERSNLELE
ncbi:MAG TPA: HAMP domain-containing protein, partial [Deinococcales bacterium]|nr:HAMP domain-containing protein [Deinococcales bacterium]